MSAPVEPRAVREHREGAPERVALAVLTVSDTRTPETDTGGRRARDMAEAAGFTVPWRRIARDEADAIRGALRDALEDARVDAIVVTGGTGASPRDVTVETAREFFDKELPGFGEIFRRISYDEIGPAAMLSRATAGVASGKPVFLLPGSEAGVALALERLVLPEVAHLVGVATRHAAKRGA